MISDWLGPILLFVTLGALLVRLAEMLRAQSASYAVRFDTTGVALVGDAASSQDGGLLQSIEQRLQASGLSEVMQFDVVADGTPRPVSLIVSGRDVHLRFEEPVDQLAHGAHELFGFAFAGPLLPRFSYVDDAAHGELVRLIVHATQVEQLFLQQPRADLDGLTLLTGDIARWVSDARAVSLPKRTELVRDYVAAWLEGTVGVLLDDDGARTRSLEGLKSVAADWPTDEGLAFQNLLLINIARLAVDLPSLDTRQLSNALEAGEAAQLGLTEMISDGVPVEAGMPNADEIGADIALPLLRAALLAGATLRLRLGTRFGDDLTVTRVGAELDELLDLRGSDDLFQFCLLDAQAAFELARVHIDGGNKRDGERLARHGLAILGWKPEQESLLNVGLSQHWRHVIHHGLELFLNAHVLRLQDGHYDLADAEAAISTRLQDDAAAPVSADVLGGFVDVRLADAQMQGRAELFAAAQSTLRLHEERAGDMTGAVAANHAVRRLQAWAGLMVHSTDRGEVHLARVRCEEVLAELDTSSLDVRQMSVVARSAQHLARLSGSIPNTDRMISLTERWVAMADVPADAGPTELREALGALGDAHVKAADWQIGDKVAHLRRADVAYGRLLDRVHRSREPLTWSLYNMRRGNALFQAGLAQKDPEEMKAGIQYFKAAEKVLTVERSPRQRLDALMRLGEGYVLLTTFADPSADVPCTARDANANALKYLGQARDLSVLPELADQRETCRRRFEAAELAEERLRV